MIVFSCTIISIILYAIFRNKILDNIHMTSSSLIEINHDHSQINLTNSSTMVSTSNLLKSKSNVLQKIDYSILILEVLNLCLLALSLCATIYSFINIRKLNYRRTTTREK